MMKAISMQSACNPLAISSLSLILKDQRFDLRSGANQSPIRVQSEFKQWRSGSNQSPISLQSKSNQDPIRV